MTKKFFATIASSVAAFSMMAAPQIDIVDPPYLIKLSTTDYADVNNKLYHVKDMLSAIQSLDS